MPDEIATDKERAKRWQKDKEKAKKSSEKTKKEDFKKLPANEKKEIERQMNKFNYPYKLN